MVTQEQANSNEKSINDAFIEMEHKWLAHWEKNGIINKYLHKNDSSPDYYSFIDGPITANNPMGVHHAWGRTYKDLWQKFHNLLGSKQRFQNGFDCQGLWVEVEVEKELGLRFKKDIENLVPGDSKASIAKFVELCKARVEKYAAIQTDQSKRLGYFMDWNNSYFTMSDDNNYMIWHFLKTCHEHGWVYKGAESVPWCPRCETAISQHEMLTEDYKEVVHESIFLELPIAGRKNEYLLVWTTTPWTIPANIAVAVDQKLEYSLVEGMSGDHYWVAKDLVESVFKKEYKKIVRTVKGSELVGLRYTAPFDKLPAVNKVLEKNPDHFHIVIATDDNILPITTEEGTGLVHTAVSAGVEDFKLGKKYGLPMIPVINDDASYMEGLGFLSGKNAKKHPELILDYLKDLDKNGENWVFSIMRYKHRYPGCWRCKTELVWKVADEWYIAMDLPSASDVKDKRTLRERMVGVASRIKWLPDFGLDRELDWLKNMHDWLISKKNRYWGLALPIYECPKCRTFEVLGSKEELKNRAISGYDKFEGHTPHKPFIDEVKIKCSSCESILSRTNDVGNPWLDAGIVPFSTIKDGNVGAPLYTKNKVEWKKWYPADFITESFPGQFKNWFYALIAMSTVLEDAEPFKKVLGFGTLTGEDGRPMHKSWGNSIAFHEGADQIGVDVMRWMYARHNPAENLAFGYKAASAARRSPYLLLWNIFKFFKDYSTIDKINLNDLNSPSISETPILDQWLLARLYETEKTTIVSLKNFDAKKAALSIETFINDFSTWYIRRSRGRVGPASENSDDRTAFYKTFSYSLKNLCIIVSPFIPFISEEIYTTLTQEESVHLSTWPKIPKEYENKTLIADMSELRTIVEVGHRIRKENALKVRQPLHSATICLKKGSDFMNKRHLYDLLLLDELNVKSVIYGSSKTDVEVVFDTKISQELKEEGEVRDLIREIQQMRKVQGLSLNTLITLTLPIKFEAHSSYIKKQVQASRIINGSEVSIQV